jgi:hypothetical protein
MSHPLVDLINDEAHPFHWHCESCGADQGERCRTAAGPPARGFHADRWEAVRLWKRYGRGYGSSAR